MFSSYRNLKLVIILYQANNAGGAWRSIMTYYRAAEMAGDAVKLINRSNPRTFRQVIAAVFGAPKLLINGLDSFRRWEAILICLFRKDTLIYLHETDYILDRFAETCPFRYRILQRIFRRNPLLAVSQQAAELYRRRFGSKNVSVIYECLPTKPEIPPKAQCKRICMVGSIDERKGASFFSRIADLAKEQKLDWELHWVGGKGSQEDCYLSKNVKWWGWLDNPREFVKSCDVFFLASVDDPFPLGCLEALQDHVRAVAYAGTGVSEVLQKLEGCAVFQNYEIGSAVDAIKSAQKSALDIDGVDRLMDDRIEVSAFRKRIDTLLLFGGNQLDEKQVSKPENISLL